MNFIFIINNNIIYFWEIEWTPIQSLVNLPIQELWKASARRVGVPAFKVFLNILIWWAHVHINRAVRPLTQTVRLGCLCIGRDTKALAHFACQPMSFPWLLGIKAWPQLSTKIILFVVGSWQTRRISLAWYKNGRGISANPGDKMVGFTDCTTAFSSRRVRTETSSHPGARSHASHDRTSSAVYWYHWEGRREQRGVFCGLCLF